MVERVKVGDEVELNSGGPPMTVIQWGYFEEIKSTGAKCFWYDDDHKGEVELFPLACLKEYVEPPVRRSRREIVRGWPEPGEA